MVGQTATSFFQQIANRVRRADRFQTVELTGGGLVCAARGAAAPAEYALEFDEDRPALWVVLRTPDRWLSESIEADLMHSGDKLEELIEEELAELNHERKVTFEHFRDEEKRYTFRSPIAVDSPAALEDPATTDAAEAMLLAYEAAFAGLGDMGGKEDAD